jgi:hypothetical protein
MLKVNFKELDERTDGIDMDFARMKEKIDDAMEKMENDGNPPESDKLSGAD